MQPFPEESSQALNIQVQPPILSLRIHQSEKQPTDIRRDTITELIY